MSDARISTGLFSFKSSKLKRQPPEAGFGWVTMFWILAFSAVTTPRRVFGVDGFQPVADQVQHEQRCVIASRPDAGSGKSRKRGRFRSVRPPVQPVGIGVLALCLQR